MSHTFCQVNDAYILLRLSSPLRKPRLTDSQQSRIFRDVDNVVYMCMM